MAAVLAPSAATAAWSAVGAGTVAVPAPAMTNASGLTAACGSKSGNQYSIVLTWVPSQHPAVVGYELTRVSGGTSVSGQVTGAGTSTATDNVGTSGANNPITYSYTIRAKSAYNWTVPVASSNTVSVSNSCSTP